MLALELPTVIGHRGIAAKAPENTLVGLRQAAAAQVTWVEMDATLTADEQVVMFHDLELERCSNGKGPIALAPYYDTVQTLDAGSYFDPAYQGEPIPTLEQTIKQLKQLKLGLNLEIKPTPGLELRTAQHVVYSLKAHWPHSLPLLVSSFSQSALMLLQTLLPDIPRGLLTVAIPEDWPLRLSNLGCSSIHCDWRFLTEEKARALRHSGYQVVVYTLNDPFIAQRLLHWGATAIISDRPDDLLQALNRRKATADRLR